MLEGLRASFGSCEPKCNVKIAAMVSQAGAGTPKAKKDQT